MWLCNHSPTLSCCDFCTRWGSRGSVRELTVINPAPPADSITHVTVLKHRDVELADTFKQIPFMTSCSLGEAETFLSPSRLCALRSPSGLPHLA